MHTSVDELAELLGGKVVAGDGTTILRGFCSLREAVPGDVSFFSDQRYLKELADTHASAVLVAAGCVPLTGNLAAIEVADPSEAFERLVEMFGVHAEPFVVGVHPSAVIHPSAKWDAEKVCVGANAVIEADAILADGVWIGPGSVVGRKVRIGEGTRLMANVTVGEGCQIGRRVTLHSGTVIGAEGFGYEFEQGRHRKVQQVGTVQIDDEVEIGAGTTVDRARFGRTWIGEGTKIDNLVQIGHNVVIGKHCIIVACCAIAGSARIGDYVVMAAQCGVAGHVSVGSMITLGGRCGVTKNLPQGPATYLGFPAVPVREEKRRLGGINRLPHLAARVKALENEAKNSQSEI